MDLPVPVVGAIDLLAQRRGVQDEVVGRAVEGSGEPAEDLAEGLGGGPDGGVVGATEVGVVAARARSRPRTPSARRTARRRRCRRPPRPAAPGARTSSRTSRQNGHSPSRMTKRAAPPSSSAMRCGIWGRSYRSRHRWLVRAPAWAPQFWTTVRYSVWPVAAASRMASRAPHTRASMSSVPTACSGRCSRGGATTVRHEPVARACASETWARPWSPASSRASSSVPTTWKAKSLSIRVRTPSPSGERAVGAAEDVVVDRARPGARSGRDGRRGRPWSRPTSR